MKLTRKQRNLLIEWEAEGLRLPEINIRAAKSDPPFEVEYLQLKHVRKSAGTKFTELREMLEAEARTSGLSRSAVRVREMEILLDGHLALIKARGEEMADEVAGGETGLMARDYKGKDADTPVYKYDAALVREIRGLLDDIARELGDRRSKVEHTGEDGGPIRITTAEDLSDDELAIIATDSTA